MSPLDGEVGSGLGPTARQSPATNVSLKRARAKFGKLIEIGFLQVWSAMRQMRDADQELSPLIAIGLKLPSYREV
ncbi:hypothetical protein TNCV_2951871 [Trichonephila clavipes]|nr:hypothetical protein TNCV_2951871 [Trichonephila clavipes]